MDLDINLLHSIFKRILSAYKTDGIYISIKLYDNSYCININDQDDSDTYISFGSNDSINICIKHFLLGEYVYGKMRKQSIFSLLNDPFYTNKLYRNGFANQEQVNIMDKVMDSPTTSKLKLIGSTDSLEEIQLKLIAFGC